MPPKKKIYAIAYPAKYRGIYLSWLQVVYRIGDKESRRFKSFTSLDEANAWLDKEAPLPNSRGDILDAPFVGTRVFIAGAYDNITDTYSGGCYFLDQLDQQTLSVCGHKAKYSRSHEAAGEIMAACRAIKAADKHKLKDLTIVYEFIGVEKWYTGEWQAKSAIAKHYRWLIDRHPHVRCHFIWQHGYKANRYYTKARQLAVEKSAIKPASQKNAVDDFLAAHHITADCH